MHRDFLKLCQSHRIDLRNIVEDNNLKKSEPGKCNENNRGVGKKVPGRLTPKPGESPYKPGESPYKPG